MTLDEWNNLRVGDIVIEKRSKSPRIVLGVHPYGRPIQSGPHRGRPYFVITMRMLHFGSWRGRRGCTMTTLNPTDWRSRLNVSHGRRARVTAAMQVCCEKHGNVCAEAAL